MRSTGQRVEGVEDSSNSTGVNPTELASSTHFPNFAAATVVEEDFVEATSSTRQP